MNNTATRLNQDSSTLLKCKLIISLFDFISLNLALVFACIVLSFFNGGLSRFIPDTQMQVRFLSHLVLSICCVAWFWFRLRHYTYRKPYWSELKEVLRTVFIFSVLDLALVAFSKWEFSRYLWVLTWVFAAIFVVVGRVLSKKVLDKLGFWKKKTIIVGTGKNSVDAYSAIISEKQLGFDVIAFVDTSDAELHEEFLGHVMISATEFDFSKFSNSDVQFILALEYEENDLRDWWLRRLAREGFRNVSVIPALRGVPLYGTDMSFFFSHEVMILRVNNNLAKRTSRIIKRSFDILGSLSLLILLSPLLAYLAYKVSRDGGNPFYGHERIGQHGKKFKCYKLRSMIINSQEVLQKLLDTDPNAKAEWDKDFKLKDDPRITKVGHFIRKTSLDELPQLWNVLKGEMSLVGPRPIVEKELERYKDDVDYYLMAKPGMTGLWQVSGRNDVDYETRVYLDSWYVKNWALWNDIAILFKTINVVLKRDGAY
ncbi:Putative colanic biosynthesis UDP-glucose lipid carrier transferase [Pragia fontium]|uniref:undecaprenyl-phosphate galactose phosphotransferase WbaP n=1 Tax=Pragia fontium TaxID=82985 RepID=UPI000E021EF6|nr:undecaprenyl-phosphate galactose phosphotransferase WbaP [Pragia fontium]SUB83271.1 Putative colanic biosynthesis UDP-glucose lipid carrier transferase [Pragia fontium]